MEETFKPENQTISKIFNCDEIYRIPNYQRQYSWTDEQLEALWDDLYEGYENQNNRCYFLGSIVVVKTGDYLDIIDGQQRITTLIIMMDVLRKSFPDINKDSDEINFVDLKKIEDSILHGGRRSRLQLQSDPNYDALFNTKIIKRESYEKLTKPTKKEIAKDNPEYKYLNTAYFFYTKFKELSREDLNKFVNYIFFRTSIIKIVCTDESFAIKLFQVLNDRGQDLANSDLVKAELFGKYDPDDIDGKNSFNVQWNNIIKIANDNEFRMDDFIVYYEYFKMRSNPKRQILDEIKTIIKGKNPSDILEEMTNFSKAIEKVFKSTNPIIYSLMYIPWRAYVITALASAYYVEYPNIESLLHVMRRFFYISFISGGTLNTIKQTSFNLIDYIVTKKPIEEIEMELNKLISSKKMIKGVYEALNSEIYDEKFLKPLLLSIDYDIREDKNTTFYKIDKELHMDHILPRAYKKHSDWDYIENKEEADNYINTLGNMALLHFNKNEECENFGFETKLRIYQGKNEDGSNKSGVTSFETTRVIISDAEEDAQKRMQELGTTEKEYIWDVNSIKRRKQYLMSLIEEMLDITEDDIENNIIEEEIINENDKWKYNGLFYDNKEIIEKTLTDFIESNDYRDFDEIPEEIRMLNMQSNLIIKKALDRADNEYDYKKVKVNDFYFYLRNCEDEHDAINYINILKKYFSFDIDYVINREELKSKITENNINQVYKISKSIYKHEIDFNTGLTILGKEMKRSSAKMYMNAFMKMMMGELYQRSISSLAARIFIDRIREDFGNEYSKKAIKSLEANLEYQKECGMGRNSKLYEVLNKQKEKES